MAFDRHVSSQVRVVADKQVAQVDNLLRGLTGHRLPLDIDSCLASDSMADADDHADQIGSRGSDRPIWNSKSRNSLMP
jgi:hypothetical protein